MNASDISKYITAGESEMIEFKSGFNDEAIETLSVFTNTKGGNILIGIKDNGEITGITTGKETFSKWLNEIKNKTAEAFYLTGDIEKYGTGFSRIRKEVASYPSMMFNFEEAPNGFLVSLSYTTQKVTGKVTDGLTDNQTIIIQLMRKNENITTKEIADKVKITQRKVKENISKLKEKSTIERLGSAKSGYWKVLI